MSETSAGATGWDTDGDGIADVTTIDADGDGLAEGTAWDSDQNGVAEAVAPDVDEDGVHDGVGYDLDQNGTIDEVVGPDGEVVGSSAAPSLSADGVFTDDQVNAMDPATFDTYTDLQNSQSTMAEVWLQPDGVSVDYNSDTNANEYTSADGDVFDTQSDAVDDNHW